MPKSGAVTTDTRNGKFRQRLKSRFRQVAKAAETLTLKERERLVKSLQKSSLAARRARLVAAVRKADEEIANGEGIEGTAEEIMRELKK